MCRNSCYLCNAGRRVGITYCRQGVFALSQEENVKRHGTIVLPEGFAILGDYAFQACNGLDRKIYSKAMTSPDISRYMV